MAQTPTFSAPVEINQLPEAPQDRYRLQHPYDLQLDGQGFLWVSTKAGKISRIEPETGQRQIVKDLGNLIHFTRFLNNGTLRRVAQDGLQGMALHPNYGNDTGEDYLYVAYVYDADSGSNLVRRLRFVRYSIEENGGLVTAEAPQIILNNLPASNDHNGGRMIYGPDGKLYYAIGDQGANQGGNRCNPNLAQVTPTQAEVDASDWRTYQGKILRVNPDGSIPNDNPVINGVRSHVLSYGHRNPQGLGFSRDADGNIPTDAQLYSNEHGHRTDDEVNLIVAGGNYGWPNVSGFIDGVGYQYYDWSSSGNCPNSSTNACQPPNDADTFLELDFSHPDFQAPMGAFYQDPNPPCSDFFSWPTFAPSSIEHYRYPNGIPGWNNSLLVTTLKRGTLYRLQLSDDGRTIVSDTISHFTSRNRYRDLAISPDGRDIYLLTDSIGGTSFAAGTNEQALLNRGSILKISYEPPVATTQPLASIPLWSTYPNPASRNVRLETDRRWLEGSFSLYDNLGRMQLTGEVAMNQMDIYLSSLSDGIYYLRLRSKHGRYSDSKRIVLRR